MSIYLSITMFDLRYDYRLENYFLECKSVFADFCFSFYTRFDTRLCQYHNFVSLFTIYVKTVYKNLYVFILFVTSNILLIIYTLYYNKKNTL